MPHTYQNGQKYGILTTTSNAGEDGQQQKFSFIADGNESSTESVQDSLVGSSKTKNALTMQFSNRASWCLPKELKNLYPHNNLHTAV